MTTSTIPAPYTPDVAIPPGATILEMLEDKGMTQAELAVRLGRPANKINELLHGKSSITAPLAIALERVLGLSASFWLELEKNFQLTKARLESEKELLTQAGELKNFPLREMVRCKWIRERSSPAQKVQELLEFFGVGALSQLDKESVLAPAFRRSLVKTANPNALAAWLRRGEKEAAGIETAAFDPAGMRAAIGRVRAMTLLPPSEFIPELVRTCAANGIATVFVPHLPKSYVCGAAYWLGGKAVVQLSLRFRTNDHFWFSLFHELGHILLHGRKETFLDDSSPDAGELEDEANQFAARSLIPDPAYRRLCSQDYRRTAVVEAFAKEIGIAPGIVVGRLQFEKLIPQANLNGLKQRYVWKHDD